MDCTVLFPFNVQATVTIAPLDEAAWNTETASDARNWSPRSRTIQCALVGLGLIQPRRKSEKALHDV